MLLLLSGSDCSVDRSWFLFPNFQLPALLLVVIHLGSNLPFLLPNTLLISPSKLLLSVLPACRYAVTFLPGVPWCKFLSNLTYYNFPDYPLHLSVFLDLHLSIVRFVLLLNDLQFAWTLSGVYSFRSLDIVMFRRIFFKWSDLYIILYMCVCVCVGGFDFSFFFFFKRDMLI